MTENKFQAELEFAKSKLPPTVDWVRINVGPTFLEFRGAVGAQNCCFTCLIAIFGSLSIWIMTMEILWGSIMLAITGLLVLAMLQVNRHFRKNPFVIDLDQQKIYPDDSREFSWTQIQMLQLVHKRETSPTSHQGRVPVDQYALLLKCEPSTSNTIVLHGYNRHQDIMTQFGDYLVILLTLYLGRSIPFNKVYTEETTTEKTFEIF